MSDTEQLTITIKREVAEAVKSKVASGEFASEGEVLSTSFLHYVEDHDESLGTGEETFTAWLREEALPVVEAMKADPSRGKTIDQVRERLAHVHSGFQKAG